MSSIDWFALLRNALWIVGLAVVLATLSYADWRRKLSEPKLTLRQALTQPPFQAAWSLGLALFCAGLALSGEPWWRAVAWAALALVFFLLGISALLRLPRGVS